MNCPPAIIRYSKFSTLLLVCSGIYWTGCAPSAPSEIEETIPFHGEAISLIGDTLLPPVLPPEATHEKDSLLEEAETDYMLDSTNLDNIIWYGRRLAYLSRYKEAISVFTAGLKYHHRSPELYRHRGHRYITTRQFDLAITDLLKAADLAKGRKPEIEPDGIPNKLNIPLSNLHFNIYYHLGLAYYLKGDYAKAIEAYESCMQYADNPDLIVATTDWLYLSFMRTQQKEKAARILKDIHPHMEIIENDGYLERLLIYKGQKQPVALSDPAVDPVEYATRNYGISCWYDLNGKPAEASAMRRMILSSGTWQAFGFIAAEADSSRLLVQ